MRVCSLGMVVNVVVRLGFAFSGLVDVLCFINSVGCLIL